MKTWLRVVLGTGLALSAHAQVILTGNSYYESFDQLGSGLPPGWSLYENATHSSLGHRFSFSALAASWDSTAGGFKNYASAHNPGAAVGDSAPRQAAYADRALGIRQTGSFGDPGAAFVLELANTLNCSNFRLSVDMQMLSVQPRSTVWLLDYRVGHSGDFIQFSSFTDPNQFGSRTVSLSLGDFIDNQADAVYLRITALATTAGSGYRDTFGIDNYTLFFTSVPEPAVGGAVVGLGLLGFAAIRCFRPRFRNMRMLGKGRMTNSWSDGL